MNEPIVESGHVLGIAENQPVFIAILYSLIEQNAHFLGVCLTFFRVHLRTLKQLSE